MIQLFHALSDSYSSGSETASLIKHGVIKMCRQKYPEYKLRLLLPFGSCKDSLNPLTVKGCRTDKSVPVCFVTSSEEALLSHLQCELTLFSFLRAGASHMPFLMQLLVTALLSPIVSLGIMGRVS